MKLLLENWRKFIREETKDTYGSEISDRAERSRKRGAKKLGLSETHEPITTLRIFDFDETIAHTESETRVKALDGSEATLRNQKEFEAYMREAAAKEGINAFDPVEELIKLGYKIDLSDFTIVKDPVEISIVTEKLKEFPENSKTYILTARRGQSLGPILNYLDKIGVDSSKVRAIATHGESKGDVMVTMIGQKLMPDGKSNINRIEYYEDSGKNIDDVLRKVCENSDIENIKPVNFELIINKVINNDGQYSIQRIECTPPN